MTRIIFVLLKARGGQCAALCASAYTTYLIAAFGAGANHKAIRQKLAQGLAVQLLHFLLQQATPLLQRLED